MTLSTILEVALGLIVFFYILSHIVQAITGKLDELWAYRAKDLEKVLRDMLTSTESDADESDEGKLVKGLVSNFDKLKNNPLIQNLAPQPTYLRDKVANWKHNGQLLPDRIPAKTFSLTLFNILFPEVKAKDINEISKELNALPDGGTKTSLLKILNDSSGSVEQFKDKVDKWIGEGNTLESTLYNNLFPTAREFEIIRETINTLPKGDTKTSLLALLAASDNSVKEFRDKIEGWFNDGMDRVSAIYRVHARRISFVVALIVVLLVDANAIAVTERLWDEPTWRAAVSAEAQDIADDNNGDDSVSAVFNQLGTLDFPVFSYLQSENKNIDYWLNLERYLGLLITWFALSLGASFWYDMMKKLKGDNSPPATETT